MAGLGQGRVGCFVVAGSSKGRSGYCTFVNPPFPFNLLNVHPCKTRNRYEGGLFAALQTDRSSWLVREA